MKQPPSIDTISIKGIQKEKSADHGIRSIVIQHKCTLLSTTAMHDDVGDKENALAVSANTPTVQL